MFFALLAEILLGVLAVFGVYMLLRTLLLPSPIRMVLELPANIAVEEIPLLVDEAREACFFARMRMVALLLPEQRENQALLEALRGENIEIYFIQT